MKKLLTPFIDELPIPSVIDFTKSGKSKAIIKMQLANAQLHRDLPDTKVWGYNGTYPGPSIEVEQGKPIQIEWKNNLPNASFPASIVTEESGTQMNIGLGSRVTFDSTKIPNVAVVHLHGAATDADSDGWTDNVLLKTQSSFKNYQNKDDATLFWYHDHAMGTTRFNVYAGLAGLYIVRNQKERDLNLPSGEFEIPLLIQDKNLDIEYDSSGNAISSKLLHKVVDDTMEFFGPLNMVNGKIYPFVNVKRAIYRFRVINGSNARTYNLKMIDENNQDYDLKIQQIGSDGGFFKKPVSLNNNELILAPAERADLIIDFTGVDIKGKKLTMVNIASAPFNGTSINLPADPINVDGDDLDAILQRNICVMQFRIENSPSVLNNYDISTFSANFKRITHKLKPIDNPADFTILPANHNHRYIALVEEENFLPASNGYTSQPMLMLRELSEIDPATYNSLCSQNEFAVRLTIDGNVQFFRSVASMFYDATTFLIRYNDFEVWKIINLTHDTHPFHVHLVQFQATGVRAFNEDIDAADETAATNRVGAKVFDISLKNPIEDDSKLNENETFWKDTIRIDPNKMMSIAMQFKGHCGRYMYHCHLLEHEDREMMRPFVVLPDYVIDNMQMGSSNSMSMTSHHH